MSETRHKYFTIGELLYSTTAIQNRINNYSIDVEQEENLDALIVNILDPAREKLGKPVIVSSGWRSTILNEDPSIRGVKNSQHPKGEAADLQTRDKADLPRLFDILKEMDVDQLLYERNSQGKQWIHVSYKRNGKNRHHINNNYKAQ